MFLIVSTPSAVYLLCGTVKSQGIMRIQIRPRTTSLSSTSATTTLPSFDVLIEEYLKKNGKDRFDDWYEKRNEGHIIN